MAKARILNLIDIFKFKKDFYWGKDYFGLIEDGSLKGSILYTKYYKSDNVVEIISSENANKELFTGFVQKYSQKGIKYFIRELDEKVNIEDIRLMNDLGFKRINRNYYYEYQDHLSKEFSIDSKSTVEIICKEAAEIDIDQIMEIEIASQALEYRDFLHKSRDFFHEIIDELFIFVDAQDMDKIYGFANKKSNHLDETFEFTVLKHSSSIISQCIEAFEEIYIRYHKNKIFRFVVNESHKNIFKDLNKNYSLISSSQILLSESRPKQKFSLRLPNLFPERAQVS